MSRTQRAIRPLLSLLFGAALVAVCAASAVIAAEVPQYRPAVAPVVAPRASWFSTAEVKLLPGPFLASREAAEGNLRSLDINRLLAPFVLASGVEPKHSPYLGWETAYLPGVGLSFYLSGVARAYAATGDAMYRDRIATILTELEECQNRTDGLLLGTLGGANILKRLEVEGFYPEFRVWGRGEATPYYALEKLMSGLRDVYRLTHEPRALQIEEKLGRWLETHLAHISDTELQKIMQVEYGGMNWVFADLYADTGDPRFLALSRRWQDNITVTPTIRGETVLEGKHANMQFPKFSGLAARYPLTGDASDLTGARLFWDAVVHHHSYATGGNSETEHFGPPDKLASRLTPFTEENCNVYNMLRLTRLLAEIEPRAEYADFAERALFNHILAAQNTANGQVCYYLPLMPGAERVYQPLEYFSCCTASGLDSYQRHAEYIYAHTDGALYVNLFVASEVEYASKRVRLTQATRFPDEPRSTLTIHCATPTDFELCIRNPYWAQGGARVSINGAAVVESARADGYFHVSRRWREGDTIQLDLPMALRAEPMPDDPSLVALFHGPILLAAELSQDAADGLVAHNESPALITNGTAPEKWLTPTGGEPLVYSTTVAPGAPVVVRPLFRKTTGPFAVYWRTTTRDALEAKRVERARTAQALDAITIDTVSPADPAVEQAHGLFGRSTSGVGGKGILPDVKWRNSARSFGYELAVSPTEANALYLRCLGRGGYEGWHCRVTVDGVEVQSWRRPWNKGYPVYPWAGTYAIPLTLTQGKRSVKVMFEAVAKKETPRILEIRTLQTSAGEPPASDQVENKL